MTSIFAHFAILSSHPTPTKKTISDVCHLPQVAYTQNDVFASNRKKKVQASQQV